MLNKVCLNRSIEQGSSLKDHYLPIKKNAFEVLSCQKVYQIPQGLSRLDYCIQGVGNTNVSLQSLSMHHL